MFFEILLLSVVVVTAYLGPMMMRRLPAGHRTYGWMLLANLGVALIAFGARREPDSVATGNLLGAIAIGAAVCLVMLPPMIRDLARRALLADRLRITLLLIDLRELLQPGLGARQERDLVESILAVRSGKVDDAVAGLRETRAALSNPLARRQIDERIVMTYLYARDWERAIAYYEGQLASPPGPVTPQLLVEMVRAYCEAGELERAAELVQGLEDSPVATEPMLWLLINRARMVFLAFVGRTTAVDSIVAPAGPLGSMPPAARVFWSGVARINAGDRTGARENLERAARLSGRDRRARELAEGALVRLDEPGVIGPHAVPPTVAELADRLMVLAARVADGPAPKRAPQLSGVSFRRVPVTAGLVAINLAVAGLVTVLLGSTSDVGALVRAGANLGGAVAAGEWWRLPASTFLHVGAVHLLLNMYGLWILGKLVEQMFGSFRFFCVYSAAGLGGAAASYFFGAAGLSAGASGAVFGVLGAAVVELALHSEAYPERWRKALLGNLLFLTAANVAIGFYYTAIDQSAHMGGLAVGAAVAALLSKQSRFVDGMGVRVVAAMLAAAGAASMVYAGVGVATTSYSDTLAGYAWSAVEANGMRWQQPTPWQEVSVVGFALGRGSVDAALDAELAEEESAARREDMGVQQPTRSVVQLPSPWIGRELVVFADGGEGEQRLRIITVARAQPGGIVWVGAIRVPELLAPFMNSTMARMLESVEQRIEAPPTKLTPVD